VAHQERNRIDRTTGLITNLPNANQMGLMEARQYHANGIGQFDCSAAQMANELTTVSKSRSSLLNRHISIPASSKLLIANSIKALQHALDHLTRKSEQSDQGDHAHKIRTLHLDKHQNQLESKVQIRTKELSLLLETSARLSHRSFGDKGSQRLRGPVNSGLR
jgi:hypothetical protein